MMTPEREFEFRVKKMSEKFRILKCWKVRGASNVPGYADQCHIDNEHNTAVIYPSSEMDEPTDYLLHEVLHVAMRALWGMDKRKPKEIIQAEEKLVQDICVIKCEK